ncbi:hypothetical protein J2X68_001009 [Streptomyces sp. 3330]|uniref:hypothetical protein n=1 Tax=Streptomyces sp. 3330 TaxID=2817755 RepID=UPI002859AC97|nr:hypothetical protein [Streptomyces sp. 3330]MDR6974331.1 hypothetical protein [Streptomyces sp. 3330]
MSRRQVLRVASACTGLAALASCAIPASDVVDAGAPATGLPPVTPLYFLSKGQLVAVPTSETATTPDEAVRILLRGPDQTVRERGLTTALSPIKPESVQSHGATVSIRLPSVAKRFPRLGLDQLVCTAAAAQVLAAPDVTSVIVVISAPGAWHYTGNSTVCPQA